MSDVAKGFEPESTGVEGTAKDAEARLKPAFSVVSRGEAAKEANKTEVSKPLEEEDPRKGLPSTVEVSEGNAPLSLSTEKKADPNKQYIKYKGAGTVRRITAHDWKSIGIEAGDCEWSYMNGMRLPRSKFTDSQLQYLLRVDGRFEMVVE